MTFEELPKRIGYKGRDYEINVYLTAWNKLCLCYIDSFDRNNSILSCVVSREVINTIDSSKRVEEILDAIDFADAIDLTCYRVNLGVKEKSFDYID